MRFLIAILILTILLFSSQSFAQAELLEKDESAITFWINIQNSSTLDTYRYYNTSTTSGTIALGYSLNGIYDYGISLSKVSETIFLGPYFDVLILRDDDNSPFSVKAGFTPQLLISNSHGNFASSFVHISILKDFKSTKNHLVQPFVSYNHTFLHEEENFISGGLAFSFRTQQNIFGFGFNYGKSEYETKLLVSAIILFL
jgi:hypothetical protein